MIKNVLPLLGTRLLFAAAMLFTGNAATPPALAEDHRLSVADAWVRMAPAALKTHGGYLTIVNSGSDADELVSASSQHYKLVEIHVSRIEDGIAVMEQLMSVEIPAGGMVMFRPGGMHLMLVGAKAPLTEGATVPIRLGFRSGAEMDVEAKVMPASSQGTNKRDQQGSGHGGHHTH